MATDEKIKLNPDQRFYKDDVIRDKKSLTKYIIKEVVYEYSEDKDLFDLKIKMVDEAGILTRFAWQDKVLSDFDVLTYASSITDEKRAKIPDDAESLVVTKHEPIYPVGTRLKRTSTGMEYILEDFREFSKNYELKSKTTSNYSIIESEEALKKDYRLVVVHPPVARAYTAQELENLT